MAEWYYRLGEDVQGPVSETDLKHIFEGGALLGETQVWCEGMQDWAEARRALEIDTSPPQEQPYQSTPPVQAPMGQNQGANSVKWIVVGACVFSAVIGLMVFGHKGVNSGKSGYNATSSEYQPTSQNPIAETSSSAATSDNSTANNRFDSQDREDMRKGRTPGTIVFLAKRAGIDETTLTSIINEKQSEIQQQGDPAGFLLNDGQLFWNMIYDSLMKTIVQSELTK